MAPNGVCHFSRYCVAAVPLVTVTFTTTLSLFARLWRSGVTLTVTSPAAAVDIAAALSTAPSTATTVDFQSMRFSLTVVQTPVVANRALAILPCRKKPC
jgi:hypothetical protein